jgi:hypothetical protein
VADITFCFPPLGKELSIVYQPDYQLAKTAANLGEDGADLRAQNTQNNDDDDGDQNQNQRVLNQTLTFLTWQI